MIKTIEENFIYIEYRVTEDSFDHEFGTTKIQNYKIVEVQIYCDAIQDNIIIKELPIKLENAVMKLIYEKEEN